MKEHLCRLLLEEYKQQCLFEELDKKGISLMNICVNNLDIVLDIIGFPRDNSLEYDYDHLNSDGELRDETKKVFDKDHFCRDWLTDNYYETFASLMTQQKISVTDAGLQIEKGAEEEIVLKELSKYIEWLYNEFSKWEKGETE